MGPSPDDVALWFLTPAERGNPHTRIDADHDEGEAWTVGNRVEALVHGTTYFRRLLETWDGLDDGDFVLFTDWRGDGDERLGDDEGTELATVLVDLLKRGVGSSHRSRNVRDRSPIAGPRISTCTSCHGGRSP